MTSTDIINRIYFLTKTNATSFGVENLILSTNKAYNRVVSLIMQSDGRWQWDDDNQTDLPVATTSIVASQQDYSITTAHLDVFKVQIKLSGATYFIDLEPRDIEDGVIDTVTTGTPEKYDKIGRSVLLEPIPNYSQSASLKVWFKRGPAEFTGAQIWSAYVASDSDATKSAYTLNGTKQPGFNSLYHDLIPLWVAYDYAVANGLPQANGWMQEILRLEGQLTADYGRRDKDDPARLTTAPINFR